MTAIPDNAEERAVYETLTALVDELHTEAEVSKPQGDEHSTLDAFLRGYDTAMCVAEHMTRSRIT